MEFSQTLIENLEKQYGMPLYVFDKPSFCTNYRLLEQTFRTHYGNYRIAYSFKTNYTPYIVKTVRQLGGLAEVVSGMEYRIAREIGYSPDEILFNGPDKGIDGIRAFLEGAIIHADQLEEVNALCFAAESNPEKKFKIGLRVNLDIGQSFVSRFGMEERDLKEAFKLVARTKNLQINGLHCHISRCRSLDAWRLRMEKMLFLADRFFPKTPEYLDLGSGMYGDMEPELSAQFDAVPSYQEYAFVTAGLMKEHYRKIPACQKPVLITEPGTTLVSRYVKLIGKVESIKRIGNKSFATLNCSIHNLGEVCLYKRLPIQIIPTGIERKEYSNLDFTGYTCLEQDVLYDGYKGKLGTGDTVVFSNVGGYSTVLKPPFIKPNCAMVALEENGTFLMIRNSETEESLMQTYHF